MYYHPIFFQVLILLSLASLVGVFLFQIWAFIKEKKDKHEEEK